MEKKKKAQETISGKDYEKVKKELLTKATDLYCKLQDNFELLAKNARKPNVKEILGDFAQEAARDCKELGPILSGSPDVEVETAEKHFGMFDHLLSVDVSTLSEEERAIISAIKISDNLRNVFTIMSNEYKNEGIKAIFDTLSKHEIYRKNELEQLYEELIVKGEW